MNPATLDKRPKLPSILTVYRPVEEYWRSFGPAGPNVEGVLGPFDALLAHLVLDLAPGFPVLVDLAAEPTAGASAVIGLNHPHVRRVVVAARAGSREADRAVAGLRGYALRFTPGLAPLDVIPIEDVPSNLSGQAQVVVQADARGGDASELADTLRLWLDELPDALVLVLGMGQVGECPMIEALLRLCSPDSGRRFRLFRELGEVLAASQLGMVARRDHPFVDEVVLRLRLLYDGNFQFLDLLKSASQAAMQATRVDDEVTRTHPLSRPLRAELDALRREAEAANLALADMTEQRDQLRERVKDLIPQTVAAMPFRAIVRRKLALGLPGKLYRASRRTLQRLRSSLA
jgi:hypothetical protein